MSESDTESVDGIKEDLNTGEENELELEHDLYREFELERNCTQVDIKKRYKKLALMYHPDKLKQRLKNDETLIKAQTEKFQKISLYYQILSDPIKRANYDKTGSIKNLEDDFSEKDWNAYFKELWSGLVNEESINKYEERYIGSEEELKDLYKAYNDSKGDIEYILNSVLFATYKSEDRFRDLVNQGIENCDIKKYDKFFEIDLKSKEKRRLRALKEEKLFEKLKKKAKKEMGRKNNSKNNESTEEDLMKLIRQKSKSRLNNIVNGLEEKYSAQEIRKSKKKNGHEDINDEDFLKLQEKLFGNNNNDKNNAVSFSKKKRGTIVDDDEEKMDDKKALRAKKKSKKTK
ncbi:hypothetical protein HK099_005231 [Clydaea vesicula]|uniref:J domain-containing protein n=1 Tax=Clydaea vesicula TaxID=447962 RepID=A0AAD5Y3S2_9FUNG|nr:hypothetical protein HK099_005231 [Clydaea vesicula]